MPDIADIYEKAAVYFSQGDYHSALDITTKATWNHPDEGPLWQLHGLTLFALGEHDQTIEALETATILSVLSISAQAALAESYLKIGKDELSKVVFRHLATLAEVPTSLLAVIAANLGKLKEHHLALEVCREAARRQPDRPEPLFGMIHYMRQLQHPREVLISVMFQIYHLEPKEVKYRVLLAWMLYENDRKEEAVALIADVDLAEIKCQKCIHRMMVLFGSAGKSEELDQCMQHLKKLSCDQSSDST